MFIQNRMAMSRLFSIEIPFDGNAHTALVSIRQQGCDLVCLVQYLDKKLQSVLQGENLVFGLLEGLKKPMELPDKKAEYLVQNTISAITSHLQLA